MKNFKFLLFLFSFFSYLNIAAMQDQYNDLDNGQDDLEIMALTGDNYADGVDGVAALLDDLDISNILNNNIILITIDNFRLKISTDRALEKKLITEEDIGPNGIVNLSISESELKQILNSGRVCTPGQSPEIHAKRDRKESQIKSSLRKSNSKKTRKSNPEDY
ncbi:hypothetical protein K9L05_02640 [Candidatus Babeliales bacterium]|nr:hypothetical protein [Candidatus Babeliales bacterium]MCF7899524.1 hypothetical protein [Candidatus Babeliales bacterium]